MKERAVFYARVSTEEEEQLNAIEKQIAENRDVIALKGWKLVDEYIDRGKSGTQIKSRDEYQRLFEDMTTEKFDIIVIKDQDRLMRNPKDWYIFAERLVQNGKKLYVYLDNTFYNPDNSLITGIKAIMAEEYSRHLSKKMNNAHRNRQKKGNRPIITNRTWGYKNVNGVISVDEDDRELITMIFEMYAKGYGSRIICRAISDKGIKNTNGKTLAESQIRAIVRNPIYKGTVVMNKDHIDFNTKKKVKRPKSEWIYHENAIEPIVSVELWEKANATIDRNIKDLGGKLVGKKTDENILSGKIECGECGERYWRNQRKTQRNNDNSNEVYWYCSEYYRYGRKKEGKENGCNNLRFKEEEIHFLLKNIGNDLIKSNEQEVLLDKILDKMAFLLMEDNNKEQLNKIREDKARLAKRKDDFMDLLVDGIITKDDYKRKIIGLDEEINSLAENENKIAKLEQGKADIKNRLDGVKEIFSSGEKNISVPIIASHLEKLLVFSDHLEVYLDYLDPLKPLLSTLEYEGGKRTFGLCSPVDREIS